MATTYVTYTGDGSNNKAFSFPSYKEADIKVEVDGTIKTTSTHYTISNYTTTGGGTIVFTSGNIPASGAAIRIFRDTEVDAAKATYTAGASIKAGDLNNNQTQVLYALQEEQNQLIQPRSLDTSAVTTVKIAADAIDGTKIADNAINSEHYTDGSIDTAHIADDQITTAKIAADAITAAKIADDVVNSEHYAAGSIDTEHIADSQVTTAKIADANVTTAKIAADAITGAKVADDAIDSEHLAADSIDAEHYAAGSVDTTALADSGVTTAKITDANVTTAKIADDAITAAKLASNAVVSDSIANGTIQTADIADAQITVQKMASDAVSTSVLRDDAVTNAKIADDQIDSEHYVDGSIDTAHIADDAVTSAKIAANAVTTTEIADAELTTLADMQSGTASILAGSTALTSTLSELNLLDGKSIVTAVSGSSTDVQLPTAKAVNDQILAITQAAGGFYPIADEVSFPNANPDPNDDAGTIVSIADAGGIVVNGSGVSTTGRTLGGSTVTINGIDSSLNSSTIAAGKGMLVQTTSTLNTYTYHRLVVDEAGVANAQTLVSDFNERYRTGSSNPTSSLDDGDLFFNTSSNKMLVYNATGSSWDEVQSVGNFYINTISSYSGTGGNSASFNGSAYRFVLSNAPTYAQQLIVSVNGVLQKPNAGTSQPSEGFAIDGSSILFSAAPASGADYFIITIGAAVNIGAPSDNQVSTASLQNSSVTTDKIANDAVTAAKIADDAINSEHYTDGSIDTAHIADLNVTTAKIAADAITGAKIADDAINSEHYTDGSIDTAHIADAQITTAKIAKPLDFADTERARFGASQDLEIYHDGSNSYIDNHQGDLIIRGEDDNIILQAVDGENSIKCNPNGSVHLYYDNVDTFSTTSIGVNITGGDSGGSYIVGDMYWDNGTNAGRDVHWDQSDDIWNYKDDVKVTLGNGNDLQIYHDGTSSILKNTTGSLYVQNDSTRIVNAANSETIATFTANGSCELYYDNAKKLETYSGGVYINDTLFLHDNQKATFGHGSDLQIYHDGTNSYLDNSTGNTYLRAGGGILYLRAVNNENGVKIHPNAAVELYYDDSKKLETTAGGVKVNGETLSVINTANAGDARLFLKAGETGTAYILFEADEGDNEADNWRMLVPNQGPLTIEYDEGNWEKSIECNRSGNVELYYDNDKKAHTYADGFQTKLFTPMADDTYNMGTSSLRWIKLYAASGSIGTSDRNEKNTIVESDLGLSFINKLKPVSYKWNSTNIDTATHYGLIAQDIEEAIKSEGKTLQDFGAVEKPANASMGLNYSEFISPLIKAVQELSAEVETLKTKVTALEAK